MYIQIFLVTSVRGRVLAPQIFAIASLSFFGAKMPIPFFFMAAAFFLADADLAFLPAVLFAAVIFFSSAFEMVVFVVVAIEGGKCKHAL